ncbi:MAG TPA: phosphatidylglycerol lysyltransferase domain-containing protein [Candidatus Saccharimonadales bacterium]|nr:phosphatidylglycerol lysyltransferase domain-containing protein [Candidatus Saccharimonadales bacterium]
MSDVRRFWRQYVTWQSWQLAYVLLSISWLLGPALDRHLSHATTFISEYEDPGRPWSVLFRACDILAALVLGFAVGILVQRRAALSRSTAFWRICVILLGVIALGSLIDDLFPSACHAGSTCLIPGGLSRLVHTGESVTTTGAFIALNLIWVLKKMPWAKTVLLIQLAWVALFIYGQLTTGNTSTVAQFAYEIVITLWVASVVPVLAGHGWRPRLEPGRRLRPLVHLIAAWVFAGGFLAIVTSIRNLGEISHRSAAYFGNNTAWLSQHGVAVGIVLMYVSRHLWRGEYRAWQLVSILLWLETLKYAAVTPDGDLVLLYGLTASVLFVLRPLFDRVTSVEELRDRLIKLAYVGAAFILALIVGVVAFRYQHHQDLDSLRINFGQLGRHFFLFDMVNDLGSVHRRLLGQVLNVAGLAFLMAILVSLFRPRKPILQPANQQDRLRLLDRLQRHSNSTEDYFKYWPQPKSYWWNDERSAVVAYRVMGNTAFALADPAADGDAARQAAAQAFMEFCRQHGWRACFLMVADGSRQLYKTSGYKLLRIGASAMVDVEAFTTKTVRNKWWRWVLNKAERQGWHYKLAEPPHSLRLIVELHRVSNAWLQRQNHKERGFALGYFDRSYLQQCRLHLLRQDGRVIAFANELPTYNDLPAATIDLMRFLPEPEYNHAMPTLLAHTIQQLQRESRRRTFDLGFVPLASPTARSEQLIKVVGQLLISEVVSAQGLEQFKNKFAPDWADNYIAFDGDWIDLLHISRQLDKLLQV